MDNHPHVEAIDDDLGSRIRDTTARLLNCRSVTDITISTILEESALDEADFLGHFSSVNDVFVEIARFMMAAYGTAAAATMVRRRSLYESIRLAQWSFLDVVAQHAETQIALLHIRAAGLIDSRVGVPDGSKSSLHEELITNCELWLEETGRVHQVTWERPPWLLATVVTASLTGVAVDYLARRDMASSREVVNLIAFDLAKRGRRRAKNSIA